MDDFKQEGEKNVDKLKRLVSLAEGYEKRVKEETELSKEQLKTRYVGKVDPKKRKSDAVIEILSAELTISQISRMSANNSSKTISSRFRGR